MYLFEDITLLQLVLKFSLTAASYEISFLVVTKKKQHEVKLQQNTVKSLNRKYNFSVFCIKAIAYKLVYDLQYIQN
jgi:hypothetical protein